MGFILFCLFFIISFGLNVFYLFNGFVPLLWIPYVLFKIISGVYKPSAIIMCIAAPIAWNLAFFVIGFMLAAFGLSKFVSYFLNSGGAIFGGIIAIINVAFSSLSSQARYEFLSNLERFKK